MDIPKIKPELRGLLTEFLADVRYQREFQKMSNIVGCTSRKPNKYRAALFTVADGEIGFVIGELNVMFADWQIEKAIKADPIISAQLADNPELLKKYLEAAKMLMADADPEVDPKTLS